MQLLPAAEGIMPSGQGRQKGEAAVAKEPTGHGVQPEDGRPLKPRTTKERTIARSLVACAIIRETNFARCSETTLPEQRDRQRAAAEARDGMQA